MTSETGCAPYATDGTDFRGALRHHYRIVLKRSAKFFPAFFVLWIQLFVFQLGHLLPIAIIGFLGGLWTLLVLVERMMRIRKCSQVFRAYTLEFRTPVEEVDQDGAHTLHLRLGAKGSGSPTMRAKAPLGRAGRPAGITAGVWSAGDYPFGGAALVPGTGELLFMQPKDWVLLADDRKNAGADRIRKARRGGIKSPTRYR